MDDGGTRERHDLRAITGDGIAFGVMVGIGETYFAAFALAGGLGELAAGLVATLPMLLGAILQLATPYGVRRLGSYRRWVVGCARFQAASFIPLALSAFTDSLDVFWLFLGAGVYWAFGMATSPAWNAWVDALVPPDRRARFFAARARWSQLALLAAVLAGGLILDHGQLPAQPLTIFGAIFVVAAGARLISARFLAAQSEPPGLAAEHQLLGPRRVLKRALTGPEGRLLRYLLAMQLGVNVALPFFTPYMLGPLGLSYSQFTTLVAVAFVARVLAYPLLGRLAQTLGTTRVLWFGALGTAPLPALWLLSNDFGYLFVLQIAAGVAWAAIELATALSFFEAIDVRERASILTLYNLALAIVSVAGTLAGGWIFRNLDGGAAYPTIFLASTALRVLTLWLLRRVEAPAVVAVPTPSRTLAVRPSVGALERPILCAVPDSSRTGTSSRARR